ncbi:KLHL18 [Mytilus coruscus]|uniref:KLHL18 n=1 Tax=Mytilus coruscus TaxID=42192 RepID=A0A6J8B5Z1_MYTCO|nr:KLHL18 [Mytilus coruscus]
MAINYEHLSSCLSDGRTVPDDGSPNTKLLDEHIDNSEINSKNKTDVLKVHLDINVKENKIREWEKQNNCDIEVSCGVFITKVHSDVLSSVSTYFKSRSNFNKQARKCFLCEKCVSPVAMFHDVNFAYSGYRVIKSDIVQDVIATASFLQVKLISDECEKFLINSIDHSTAISLLQCAIKFNLINLIDTIVLYISENFDTFVEQNLFCTLSTEEFRFLLLQRNLSVFRKGIPVNNPELHILQAAGKTITAKQVKDIPTVKDILSVLSAILFSEIPEDDLSYIYNIHPAFNTIDRSTFLTLQTSDLKERKFSNSSKLLESSECHLQASHLKSKKSFEEVSAINDRPKKVGSWVTIWERYTVIGGIRVEYQSKTNVLHGILPKARHSILSEYEFELDDDEVITNINLMSGMLIDSISFNTNYGRTYGPYGGNGGYPSSSSPSHIRGYFHSFKGNVLKGKYYDPFIAITDITWVVFTEPNTNDYDRSLKARSKSEDNICICRSMETKLKMHVEDFETRYQEMMSEHRYITMCREGEFKDKHKSAECYLRASHLKSEKSFKEVSAINDRPKKVGLWVTNWERYTVIGGIRVEYQSKTNVLHGILPKARHSILSEYEFELDDDEVITNINLMSEPNTNGYDRPLKARSKSEDNICICRSMETKLKMNVEDKTMFREMDFKHRSRLTFRGRDFADKHSLAYKF